MLSPRWRKVWRDLWSNKTRTLIVLLSIAVGVTAIGIEADLVHPHRAVRRAGEVDMTPLPAHRRAAAYIDVARAYRLTGNAPAVMHMLGKAARESTEVTEREPFVRMAVVDLMENGGYTRVDVRGRRAA